MLKKTTKKKRNPNSKSKQKPQKTKKLRNVHDSNCSLLEDPPNPASISDLFKNDALKKKHPPLSSASQINFSSTINNYTSVYTVISSIHPPKLQKPKSSKNISKPQKKKGPQKAKSKTKLTPEKGKQPRKKKQISRHQQQNKAQRLEPYELIPPSKNSLNSEIVFSTQETKRESEWEQKRREESSRIYDSLVRVSQENLVNNNKMLRSTIKQQFKRKNEAATKIQKVFRGFLTRKILQKYIREEQEKLYGLLENYKSFTRQQPSSPSKSKHSHVDIEFFSNRTHEYSPKTFKDEESINLSKVNPSHYRFEESKVSSDRVHSNRFFHQREEEIINCEDELASSQDESGQDPRAGSEEDEQTERLESGEDDDSESSKEVIAYRHQQAIYNGAQIQQYLNSSSSSSQQGKSTEKLPKIISEDQIIFETNEEHIESRKNSLLNKNQQNCQSNKQKNNQNVQANNSSMTFNIVINALQDSHGLVFFNQMEELVDQDLIKTSKVNSIQSHSQKGSIKSSEAVSPKTRKEILEAQNNQAELPSERTSKKECKKLISHSKHSHCNPSPNTQKLPVQIPKPHPSPLALENLSENLNTIKLPNSQKYSPPNLFPKQVFMDTISYNTEFKVKHQITPSEELGKRKESMKKRIYYFSDESERADTPRSGSNERRKDGPDELERLKNLEIQRWDEVVRLVNCQLKDMTHATGNSREFQSFVKQVMDLSLKNKEILKEMITPEYSLQQSEGGFQNSRIDEILQEKYSEDNQEKLKKWKDFKETLSSGRRKSITEQDIAVFRPNSRVILSNKNPEKQSIQNNFLGSPKSKPFFTGPKHQLKKKINKLESENFQLAESQTREFTLTNFENDQIQQMLKIREEMLEKRECEELTKLNQQLLKKQLTQKEFLQQLKQLTDAFQLEKQSIDKAREDITKGYSAAVKLIREAFSDARKIGYKLPMSKSSDSYKLNKHLGFGVLSGLNNVIIDELNSKQQAFAMKHIKGYGPEGVKKQPYEEKELKSRTQVMHQQSNDKPSRLSALEAEYIDSKQFTRSQPSEVVCSNNTSHNFSQNPSSIINNLTSSKNSFENHFFEAEISPKHQVIAQTPDLTAKSNIFTQNGHEFDDMSEESSEIEFSQEELKRFRKAQPYDPSIADMNRNLMIGKQFFQMQKFSDQQDFDDHYPRTANEPDPENLRVRLYREVYEIEQHSIDSGGNDFYPSKPFDPKVQLIVQKQLQFLVFQIASELLMRPLFSEKFLQPKRQEMFGIRRVSDECRKEFIRLVEKMMPNKEQIFSKINQNISPLPRELLKCMRIDFSQDEEEENDEEYEEIGKYEMILDQDMCNSAIDKYHERMAEDKQNRAEIELLTGDNISTLREEFAGLWPETAQERVFAYLQQRQKFVTNRKQHCESIRWEFINMELHCLFDAWNEQIIQLKNNHSGFSGIGLNQLTLSMIDRNRRVNESQVQSLVQISKFKLMKLLNYDDDIINEINDRAYRQVSVSESQLSTVSLKDRLQASYQHFSWVYVPNKDVEQELDTEEQSRWVYYADEALSYGLELVYLMEEELFSELAKDLRKLTIKGQFL